MTSSERERFYEKLIADGRARQYVHERDKDRKDAYVVVFSPFRERRIDTPHIKQHGHWACEYIPYAAAKRRIGLTVGLYDEEGLDKALRDLEALGRRYDVLLVRSENISTLRKKTAS